MKKIYLFLLLALTAAVLCSCVKEEYIDEVVGISTTESSYYVPVEDAIGELYQFLSELNDETRSESRPKIADVQVWDNFATTRSDGSAESPILYVVNFENEEGFAILSGDSRIVSVIAVTEEGSFDIYEEITHAGMRMYVSMLGDYVDTVMNDSGNSGVIPYVDTIEDIGIYTFTSSWQKSGEVGTIIPGLWGQGDPFNLLCPQDGGQPCLVGCGAVAVGLIMSYWQHDTIYNRHSYKWKGTNGMSNIITGDKSENKSALTEVQNLLAAIGDGNNLKMEYGVSESGYKTERVRFAFTNFGYSKGGKILEYYSSDEISTYLKTGPVLVSGYKFKEVTLGIFNSYKKGHIWVVDKYYSERRYHAYISKSTGKETGRWYESRSYVHCNWGWNGSYNGYFYNGVFNIYNQTNITTRSKTYGQEGYYQYKLETIIDICP